MNKRDYHTNIGSCLWLLRVGFLSKMGGFQPVLLFSVGSWLYFDMKQNLKSQLEAENRDIGIGKSATNQWMASLTPQELPMATRGGDGGGLAWHQTLPRLGEANRTERRAFGAGHLDVLKTPPRWLQVDGGGGSMTFGSAVPQTL